VLGPEFDSPQVHKYSSKVDGFELTGKVAKSKLAGHSQLNFEIADLGGNRNDLWVVLSSYGISLDQGVFPLAGCASCGQGSSLSHTLRRPRFGGAFLFPNIVPVPYSRNLANVRPVT
jgi:hypothetical protein